MNFGEIRNIVKNLMMAGLAVSTLSGGCAKENNDLTITVVPGTPIAFDAPFSVLDPNVADTIITLTPPWFGARFKLKNNRTDGKAITLPAMTLEIFQGTTSVTCVIALTTGVLITIKAGDGIAADDGVFVGDTVVGGVTTNVRTWYCDSLPKSTTSSSSSSSSSSGSSSSQSLKYTVKLKAVGWYGDANNPESRFQKVINFTTE